MVRKLTFTFTDKNLDVLIKISEEGKHDNLTSTLVESLALLHCFQTLAKDGFNEVFVVNAATKQERMVLIPNLKNIDLKSTSAAEISLPMIEEEATSEVQPPNAADQP